MDQLLIALDVHTLDEALALADRLRGVAGGFKIGSTLFTAEGPRAVQALVERGDRIFLDLKYHDIPNTVAGAVRAATRLGVWMLNVHASGGRDMMRAARDAAHDAAVGAHRPPPKVIAVTVLTSLTDQALDETGVRESALDHVLRLAALTEASGLDGVVASPQETAAIRARSSEGFTIVTPGIRGAGTKGSDDQARTMGPGEALRAGASYLVVGRPVVRSADPRTAAEQIVAELECRSA